MCRKIAIIIVLTMFLAAFYFYKTSPLRSYSQTSIRINNQTIKLYLAETEVKREQGLSGVSYLAPNEGMLFTFNHPDYYGFWMKGMRFPLDLIFINNRQIIDIISSVAPYTYPHSFRPSAVANCVIELNAGETKKLSLSIGSKLDFADNLCQ